jgi:flagellar hook assembly protein FlgD
VGNHAALMEYSVVVSSPEHLTETNNFFSIMPNPVRDHARISFEVTEPSQVRIYVFDINGQAIDMLENGYFSSGNHELNWNACDRNGNRLPANTYLVSVQVNGEYFTKKLIVQ